MSNPVGFGIIGCGGWARNVHLPNLKLLPEAEIRALSSRNDENLQQARALCPGEPACHRDWRDLLREESVDAVLISTSNQTHAELTLAALAAGKHVLVEKPLATNAADCDRVVEAAAASDRLLQVGLELRYSDLFTAVKERLRRGAVGTPRMLWGQLFRRPLTPKGWRLDPEAGGVFLELGIHYLDLMTWLGEAAPRTVYSSGGSRNAEGSLDAVFTTLEYDAGIQASLAMCLFSPTGSEFRLGVWGDEGRLTVELDSRTLEFWPADAATEGPLVETIPVPPDRPIHGFDGTYQQLAAFCECLRSGAQPAADVYVGRESVRTALAAAESAATGVPLRLDL